MGRRGSGRTSLRDWKKLYVLRKDNLMQKRGKAGKQKAEQVTDLMDEMDKQRGRRFSLLGKVARVKYGGGKGISEVLTSTHMHSCSGS